MQKRIVQQDAAVGRAVDPKWLDLEQLAQVELTSEEAAYPIEGALISRTV